MLLCEKLIELRLRVLVCVLPACNSSPACEKSSCMPALDADLLVSTFLLFPAEWGTDSCAMV